jgi:hypothetical protein
MSALVSLSGEAAPNAGKVEGGRDPRGDTRSTIAPLGAAAAAGAKLGGGTGTVAADS